MLAERRLLEGGERQKHIGQRSVAVLFDAATKASAVN
jgi:hypothetical protein